MKKHYRHQNDCLNCGTELQGKFCYNCGQENLEMKESFRHMLNHAISDYFHFDAQFFDTLKPLLFKPGKLTVDYLEGRRARYLHPVKMYIFISLVYFLLVFKTANHKVDLTNNKQVADKEVAARVKKELAKNHNLTEAQKKQIETQVKTALPKTVITPLTGVTFVRDPGDTSITKGDTTLVQYQLNQQKLPVNERDGILKRFINEKTTWYQEHYGKEAIEHFVEDVQHNIPKMMFVLLPLFALTVKIAFWKNHKYYVEHLIYAIHLHCYFFLTSAAILVIKLLVPNNWDTISSLLDWALFLYTVYYIYRSLRLLYQRTRWRTIIKMLGMSFIYLLAFIICIGGVVMLTVATL